VVDGTLDAVPEGSHWLEAWVQAGDLEYAETGFTLVALQNPEECDILNDEECELPFPSSRFEEPAPTATGVRIAYGANTLPNADRIVPGVGIVSGPVSPAPFLQNDGVSPTTQVLMHFERVPDPELSGAARILPDTRIYDEREQSLTFVCEQPVLLEQRLFKIGREIMARLT